MKVVIPGGTGQVGSILTRHFSSRGHEVVVLARSRVHGREAGAPEPHARTALWDGKTLGAWASEIDGADVVVNLAGRSVNCRHTERNLKDILESRVDSTRVVGQAIASASQPPPVWLQASAADIYAHTDGPAHGEAGGIIGGDEPGLPRRWARTVDVVRKWEAALEHSKTSLTRKVALRISMVLSPDRGGAFDVLSGLVRRGLGGPSGHGRQYVSWIVDTDFVRGVDWLIEHRDVQGAVNMTAPFPLPNAAFMRALREAWGMAVGLPAANWMVSFGAWMMGTEPELVLKSRRVVPERLLTAGFAFDFPEWPSAAKGLVDRSRGIQNLAKR